MRIRNRSTVLYSLALGAVGLAWLASPATERHLAPQWPPPMAPRALTARSAPSCPLPVGQQVKAVKAFREMMPVFRHPRCLNCHGGLDLFSDRHPGAGALDERWVPGTPMDEVTRDSFSQQCADCHDNIRRLDRAEGKGGWTVPGEPVFFVDGDRKPKSDEELCFQMKRMESPGEKFVEHIRWDHGTIQFIEAGFAGDRALGEEGLIQEKLKRESPEGNQAQLTEKARKWVEAVGEGYQSSPECGCVMPKIKLEINHTMMFEVPKGLPSKEESQVRFEMKLEPTGDPRLNMFAGEHSLNREIKMTLPPTCKGKASRQERWLVYALVDSVTGSIKVRHTAFDDEPTGEIVCNQGRGTATMGIFPGHVSLVDWEVVIPADSGSSKTLQAEDVGRKEALTITLLEVPEGE